MAKYRDPFSIHDATRKAHAFLGDETVERVTERSAALVGKWSDPDADRNHIPLHQAIKLDVEMLRRGQHPAHFEAFKVAIEDALPQTNAAPVKPPSLSEMMLAVGSEFGDVSKAVTIAGADGRISPAERRRIVAECEEMRTAINAILRVLR